MQHHEVSRKASTAMTHDDELAEVDISSRISLCLTAWVSAIDNSCSMVILGSFTEVTRVGCLEQIYMLQG